ncbi:MAG: outer membrane lipoprotein LolB [Pseudomonadota bacterium]
MSGKLAVRSGSQGQSMRFDWRQYADGYVIAVWGPLGQGRTLLTGNQAHMTVTRGAQVLAAGPQARVMQQQLGWSLPVMVLGSWIRGQPHPGLAVMDLLTSDAGDVEALQQAGWFVRFSQFVDHSTARAPGRIVATRDDRKITVLVRSFATR